MKVETKQQEWKNGTVSYKQGCVDNKVTNKRERARKKHVNYG
jgi:hypothetical protein